MKQIRITLKSMDLCINPKTTFLNEESQTKGVLND